MKNPLTQIRHSLSMRISLWVLLFAVLIFVVSLGFLYFQTRTYIRQDAMQRAEKVLNNNILDLTEMLADVEIATNNTLWLARTHPQPDSIEVYARSIVELNSDFYGCSIAFEPNYFKEKGEYFSIYAYREKDSIYVEQEGSDLYRYFEMDWYTKARETGEAHWIDPFYDFYLDNIFVKVMITSYSKPFFDNEGNIMGVVSTDLSMQRLSLEFAKKNPSPHSYFFMLSKDGGYCMHPDTMKLSGKTIFSDRDPEREADVIALGKDMISGKEGMRKVEIDGVDSYVFFRPLARTGWSFAVVFPESEIFSGYNRLFYIVLGIIVVGLILMLFLCRHIVKSAIVPMEHLAQQARHIATGNFSERLPLSDRVDAVGTLQNSFSKMQQSISNHISDIELMNAEIEQRNEEQVKANELAQEAVLKKTAFMQDITHQVRTPLNIITGFAQVLREGTDFITEEEMVTIIDAMQENSKNLKSIISMLMAASYLEDRTTLERGDDVKCNELCHEVADSLKLKNPGTVKLKVESSLPDSFSIRSHRKWLFNILRELLDNANRFTREGFITISCSKNGNGTVNFIVTDTGIGVAEEDHQRIFAQFTKLDDFTEGIGLGLTLCKRVAMMLDGDLNIDADYTDGARFILTLPEEEL
ncbi:MAG: HAMP domain-containing protein [Bacteroidaceae bacterium]|nr:HAMP domain-containing protein [Bacteroidaceae bacterium]